MSINPSTYGQNVPLNITQDIDTNPPLEYQFFDNSLNGFTHLSSGVEYPFSQLQNNFRPRVQNPVFGMNLYTSTTGLTNLPIFADTNNVSSFVAVNQADSTYSQQITPKYDKDFTFTGKVYGATTTNDFTYTTQTQDQVPANTPLYTIQNLFDTRLTPSYSRLVYNSINNDWFIENNRETDYKLYDKIIPSTLSVNYPYASNFITNNYVPIWKVMSSQEQYYLKDGELLYYNKKRNIHSSTHAAILYKEYETNEILYINNYPTLNLYEAFIGERNIPYYASTDLNNVIDYRYFNTFLSNALHSSAPSSKYTFINNETLNVPDIRIDDIWPGKPMLDTDRRIPSTASKIKIELGDNLTSFYMSVDGKFSNTMQFFNWGDITGEWKNPYGQGFAFYLTKSDDFQLRLYDTIAGWGLYSWNGSNFIIATSTIISFNSITWQLTSIESRVFQDTLNGSFYKDQVASLSELNEQYTKINIHGNAVIDAISTSNHEFTYLKDRMTIKMDNDTPTKIISIDNPFNVSTNLFNNYFDQYFGFPMNSDTTLTNTETLTFSIADVAYQLLEKNIPNPIYYKLCSKIRHSRESNQNVVDLATISQKIITNTEDETLFNNIPLKNFILTGETGAVISSSLNIFEILYQDNNIFLFLYYSDPNTLSLGYSQYIIPVNGHFRRLPLNQTSSSLYSSSQIYYQLNLSIPLVNYVGYDMNYILNGKITNVIEDVKNNFENYNERILMFHFYDTTGNGGILHPFELDIYYNMDYEHTVNYVNIIYIDPIPYTISINADDIYMKSLQLFPDQYSIHLFKNNTSNNINAYVYKNQTQITTNTLRFCNSLTPRSGTTTYIPLNIFDIINIFVTPYSSWENNSFKELYYPTVQTTGTVINCDVNLIIINSNGSMKYTFQFSSSSSVITFQEADLENLSISSTAYNINSQISLSGSIVTGTTPAAQAIANYINTNYAFDTSIVVSHFNLIRDSYAYTQKSQLATIENNKLFVFSYNNIINLLNTYFYFCDVFDNTYYNQTLYYEIDNDNVIYSITSDTGFNNKNRVQLQDPFGDSSLTGTNIFNNELAEIKNNSNYSSDTGTILGICVGNNDMIYVSSNYIVTYFSKSKYSTQSTFSLPITNQTTSTINLFYAINTFIIWNSQHLFLFKPNSSSTKLTEEMTDISNSIIHIMPATGEIFRKIDLFINNELLIVTNTNAGAVFMYTYSLTITEIPFCFTSDLKLLNYDLSIYGGGTLNDQNIVDIKQQYMLVWYDTKFFIFNLTLESYTYFVVNSNIFNPAQYNSMLLEDNYLSIIFKIGSSIVYFMLINRSLLDHKTEYEINQINVLSKTLPVTSTYETEQFYLNNLFDISFSNELRSGTITLNDVDVPLDMLKMVSMFNFQSSAEISATSFYVSSDLFLMFLFTTDGNFLYYANNIFNDQFSKYDITFYDIFGTFISYGSLDGELAMGFIDMVKNTYIYKITKNGMDLILDANIFGKNIIGDELIINGVRINDYLTKMNTSLISYQTEINNAIELTSLFINEESQRLRFDSQTTGNTNVLNTGSANYMLTPPNNLYSYFLAQQLGYFNAYNVSQITVEETSNTISVYNGSDFKSIMCMFIDPINTNPAKYTTNPGTYSNSLLLNPNSSVTGPIPISIRQYWNGNLPTSTIGIDNDYLFNLLPFISNGAATDKYFYLTNLLYINPNTDIAIGPVNNSGTNINGIFGDDRNNPSAPISQNSPYRGLLLFHQTAYHRNRFEQLKQKLQTQQGYFNFPTVGSASNNYITPIKTLDLLKNIIFTTMSQNTTNGLLTYDQINTIINPPTLANPRKDITLYDIINQQWFDDNVFNYLKIINQDLSIGSSPQFSNIYFKINQDDLFYTSLRTVLGNYLTHFNIYYLNMIDQSLNTESIPEFAGVQFTDEVQTNIVTVKKIDNTDRINVLSEDDISFNNAISVTQQNATHNFSNELVIENVEFACPSYLQTNGFFYTDGTSGVTVHNVNGGGSNSSYIENHKFNYSDVNYTSFSFISDGVASSAQLFIYRNGSSYQFMADGAFGNLFTSNEEKNLFYINETLSLIAYGNTVNLVTMVNNNISYTNPLYTAPAEEDLILRVNDVDSRNIWQFGSYILIKLNQDFSYIIVNALGNPGEFISINNVAINYINPKMPLGASTYKYSAANYSNKILTGLIYFTNDVWWYYRNNKIIPYMIQSQYNPIENTTYLKRYDLKGQKNNFYVLSSDKEAILQVNSITIFINMLLNQYDSSVIEILDLAISSDNNCILLCRTINERIFYSYSIMQKNFTKINTGSIVLNSINNIYYDPINYINYISNQYIILEGKVLYSYNNQFGPDASNSNVEISAYSDTNPIFKNKTFVSYPNYIIDSVQKTLTSNTDGFYSNFYKKINDVECYQNCVVIKINNTNNNPTTMFFNELITEMFFLNNTYYFISEKLIYKMTINTESVEINQPNSYVVTSANSSSGFTTTASFVYDGKYYVVRIVDTSGNRQYEILDGNYRYELATIQQINTIKISLSYSTNDSIYLLLMKRIGNNYESTIQRFDEKNTYPQILLNFNTKIDNFSIKNNNLLIETNGNVYVYKFKYVIVDGNSFSVQLTLNNTFNDNQVVSGYNIGSYIDNGYNDLEIVNIDSWASLDVSGNIITMICYIEQNTNDITLFYDLTAEIVNNTYQTAYSYILSDQTISTIYANIAAADPIQPQDLVTLKYFNDNLAGISFIVNVDPIVITEKPYQPYINIFLTYQFSLSDFNPTTTILKLTTSVIENENSFAINLVPQSYTYSAGIVVCRIGYSTIPTILGDSNLSYGIQWYRPFRYVLSIAKVAL